MLDYLLLVLIVAGIGMPMHYLQGALRSRRVRKSLNGLSDASSMEDECSAIAGDSLVCRCGSH